MEGELTCSVCLELFDQPLMLSCGHNFCRKCVRDVVAQRGVRVRSFPCPTCRKDIRIDNIGGLDNLPRNIALENIVKIFRSNQLVKSGSFILPFSAVDKIHLTEQCTRHKQPKNLYCQMCKVVACVQCGVESHSLFGHNAKPSPQILKEEEYKVKTQVRELELWFKEVKERQDCLADTKKSIDAHQKVVEKQLEHDCQGLIELIFSKQHELKASLLGDLNQLKGPLSETQAQLRILQNQIEDVGQEFKAICEISNPGGRIQALENYGLKLQSFLISKPALIKQALPEVETGSRVVMKEGAEGAIKEIKWKVKGSGHQPSNKAILKSGLFGSRHSLSKNSGATATKTPDQTKDSLSGGYSFVTAPLGPSSAGISSGFFNISAPLPNATLSATVTASNVVFTGASSSVPPPTASGVSGLFSAGPSKQPFRPTGLGNSTVFVPATVTSRTHQPKKHSKTSSNVRRRGGVPAGGATTSSGVMSSNFVITLPSAGLKPSLPGTFISAPVPSSGPSLLQSAGDAGGDSTSVPGLPDSSAWLSSASAYISQKKSKSFFPTPAANLISSSAANDALGQPTRAETTSKWCYPPFVVDTTGAAAAAATTTTEADARPSTVSTPTAASAFGSMFAIPGSFSFKFSPANATPKTTPDQGLKNPNSRQTTYFEPIDKSCVSSTTSSQCIEGEDREMNSETVDRLAVQVDEHLAIAEESATGAHGTNPQTANSSAFGIPYLSPSSSGAEADSESDSFAPDNTDTHGIQSLPAGADNSNGATDSPVHLLATHDNTTITRTMPDRQSSDLASVLSDSIHNSSGSSSESFSSVKSQPEDGSTEGIAISNIPASPLADSSGNLREGDPADDIGINGASMPTVDGFDNGDNREKLAAAEPSEKVRIVKESYQRDEHSEGERNDVNGSVEWNQGSYVMLHSGKTQPLPGLVATASCNHTITLAVAGSGQQVVQTVPSDSRFKYSAYSDDSGNEGDKAKANGCFGNIYYRGIPADVYVKHGIPNPLNSSGLGRRVKQAKRFRRVHGKDVNISKPVDDESGYAFNVPTSGTTLWTFTSKGEHESDQIPFMNEEQSKLETTLTEAQTDRDVSGCMHTENRSVSCKPDDCTKMSDRKLHEQEDLIDRARQYMQEAVCRQREILDKVTANLKHTEDLEKTG